MNPRTARLAEVLLVVLGVLGWAVFIYATWFAITVGWTLTTGNVRLVDWHVFDAGARQLADRSLYRVPLAIEGLPLSATEFRLPPFSAVWPLPLAGLPVETGGIVWQVLAAASIAVSAVLGAALVTGRRAGQWAGVVLGLLALTLFYLEGLHLGTNNYLVLVLVAGFSWLYLRGHSRLAGVALGLAIATKLWPATLAVVAVRERRWTVLVWAAALVALQGLIVVAWLGPDVVGPMLGTVREQIPPTGYLLGPGAIPGLRDVWNGGLGLALGVGLLLIPARGRLGLGLGILAAMAVIGNLWIHYAPTIAFALVLVVAGILPTLGGYRRTDDRPAGASTS